MISTKFVDFAKLSLPVLGLMAIVFSPSANGDLLTVTFDNVEGPNGGSFNSLVENGYTVTARTGDWQISRSSPAGGNPQPSIFSRSTNAQVSLEGPLFHLISFQTNDGSINSGISTATYSIEGFLNNTLVLSGSGTVSPDWEANSNPNPLQPLDRILISFNIGQTTSYGIDNIQLQAVPEPSFYFLLATFVGVFLIRSFCGHCYGFIRFGRGL